MKKKVDFVIDERQLITELELEIGETYNCDIGYGLKRAIEIVEHRPLVGEWIPCSERLPEEDGEYLVWVRYEGREFTTTEEYEDGMWNYSGAYNFNDKVIAWMPLPEQYKEEEEKVINE
jgi:hypothetical protein